MKKISVIIPVFRVEKYLTRCINSVVNQTYKNIEIIIVDDGSDDKCPEICDSWAKKDNRIKVIHKKNGGLSSARNAGLSIATGDYISFVDSDDWLELEMYEILYKALIGNQQCEIAECKYRKATDETDFLDDLEKVHYQILDNNKIMDKFYRVGNNYFNPVVWNKLIKKELLIDFKFANTLNEDWEATFDWYRKTNNLIFVDKILYNYYFNRTGIVNSKFKKQRLEYLSVWDRLIVKTEKFYPRYVKYAQFQKTRAYFTLLSQYIFNGAEKNNQEYKDIYNMLKTHVIRDFWILLNGLHPNSRKILLLLIIFLPRLARFIGNSWRKFRHI